MMSFLMGTTGCNFEKTIIINKNVYADTQNSGILTDFKSIEGNFRIIYLILDSKLLSDKNAGFDLASPHA